MTARKMGRPPGPTRRRQVFAFVHPDLGAWFMALAPKERTAWLEEKIEAETGATRTATRTAPEPSAPIAHPDAENRKQT